MAGKTKLLFPDAQIRSPTAVPGHADIRAKLIEVKFAPTNGWVREQLSRRYYYNDLVVKRIAAQGAEADRDVILRCVVNGRPAFEASFGALFDAYEGRGAFSGGEQASVAVAEKFGTLLAKVDRIANLIEGKTPATAPSILDAERLGGAMNAVAEAVGKLGQQASGLPVEILVGRQDDFFVETVGAPITAPARLVLFGKEKMDAR